MAGEHVKDAKQATGVRATITDIHKHKKLSFFLDWPKYTIIVTSLLQLLLILELCRYIAMHIATEMTFLRRENEKRKSLAVQVLCCGKKSVRLVQSVRFNIFMNLTLFRMQFPALRRCCRIHKKIDQVGILL